MKRLIVAACCLVSFAASAAEPTRAQLEARLDALETTLAGDVCLDPRAARAVLEAGLPGESSAAPAVEKPTAAAARAALPADAALPRDQLVARLKQAVVLVLTPEASGSGFFVTPDTLITNAHVIEGANGKIALIGPGVGGAEMAQVVAVEAGKGGLQARDYAILRVTGAKAKATLPIAAQATELEPVIAAGFPGLLLDNDIHFQRLLRGTPTGLPDLILSQGSIMAVQNRGSSLPTIAHSAAISAGNSGGPLVDSCGRVVGINTFIRVSVDQASHAGYAIAAEDVLRFLAERGVRPTVSAAPCR
ncbi:Trypsin-like serine proteases, typically periplasmic, contain C-terminal PDZ domain [uncultured Alphaproteobacteria bacterium]|uniref:Trypsin-like serine proteases, typically periplasmic, contain C-terminal PDZ domain n=1 Tax=uncultured Alphaproteobacteria bacterium TaxID=91750 RepID=A0A212IW87_9PROT|nr:Trypsin-like serine proteases, typically periplasmic, contain C-terminal PDZ domain [uncultured Alphaproteobacteria bacterium]